MLCCVMWRSGGYPGVKYCNVFMNQETKFIFFLLDLKFSNAETLCDPHWVVLLAYLAAIFDKLNSLNVSFQGAESTVFDLRKKVTAFKRQLDLWKTVIKTGSSVPFLLLTDTIKKTESELLSCGAHQESLDFSQPVWINIFQKEMHP